jgi:hypothetical protein
MEFEMKEIDPIPANENPFRHDLFHMGGEGPSDVMMMFAKFGPPMDVPNKYVTVVHIPTGRRVKIMLPTT